MTDSAMQAHGGVIARGVKRSFGSVEAVRNIDLDVPPGQVTALVGPNGAGKTTLLLMLATLLTPDSGQIRIAGLDPVREPLAVRARIGWSPDVFGTYDNLLVREYLEFFANAYRLPAHAITGRVAELLRSSRLEEFSERPVHTLSRGQKQRLGMARSLVHSPSVLLLDEPASGLDPRSRIELRDMVRSLAAGGAAVLVSSHILSDLEEVADRVVFVDNGATVGSHNLTDLQKARSTTWLLRSIDPEALTAALTKLGREHRLSAEAGTEVIVQSVEDAADLIAALVNEGARVYSSAPAGGALESAYLEMTEGRG